MGHGRWRGGGAGLVGEDGAAQVGNILGADVADQPGIGFPAKGVLLDRLRNGDDALTRPPPPPTEPRRRGCGCSCCLRGGGGLLFNPLGPAPRVPAGINASVKNVNQHSIKVYLICNC
jgi:hypothetical protein